MHVFHRILLSSLLWTVFSQLATAQDSIAWLVDLRYAQQIAKQQQRLVLLHFSTSWCGPCRKLEHNVFPNNGVVRAISQNYVPVKIDGDKAKNLVSKYGVKHYPTDVFLTPDGDVITRVTSPQNPVEYAVMLDQVAAASRPQTANMATQVASNAAANPAAHLQQQNANGWANQGRFQSPPRTGRDVTSRNAPFDPRTSQFAGTAPQVAPPVAHNAPQGNAPQGNQFSGYGDVQPKFTAQMPPGAQFSPEPRTQPTSGQYGPSGAPSGSADSNDWSRTGTMQSSYNRPSAMQARADAGRSPGTGQGQFEASSYGQTQKNAADHAFQQNVQQASAVSEPQPALDGYCPVMLAEHEKWNPGDSKWGAIHRGRTYLFTSADHQAKFLNDPDRYSPVFSGYDAVRFIEKGQVVQGKRGYGMWFMDKMYLFADDAALKQFSQAPDYYAQRIHEVIMNSTN